METVSIWINEDNETDRNTMELPMQLENPGVKIQRATHTRLADVHNNSRRWNLPVETYPVFSPNVYYHSGNQPQVSYGHPNSGFRMNPAFNVPPKPAFSETDFSLEANVGSIFWNLFFNDSSRILLCLTTTSKKISPQRIISLSLVRNLIVEVPQGLLEDHLKLCPKCLV
jgi:hypothetical protein